ncbi:peroxisomal membrane protein 13 [Cocos nucifera]|nr:peroxisomal membrane protein 13 [Cocos nucifera]
MASTNSGATPPPKPWEQAGNSSGPAPFKPPSSGSTSEVVEASGTANAGEIVPNAQRNTSTTNTLGRPLPPRPWEQSYGNSCNFSFLNTGYYNSGYGSSLFGPYGTPGGAYNSGLYGNSMYRSFGGFGGNMYSSGFGGPLGPYGMGVGGPYGNEDPNNPYGPSSPPGFWISFIRVMNGVVNFFGRISILIDQNTQAFHLFMSALLQIIDRTGLLYGELARFVLRLLGIRRKPRKHPKLGSSELSANSQVPGQKYIEGPRDASGSWDNVWGDGIRGSS